MRTTTLREFIGSRHGRYGVIAAVSIALVLFQLYTGLFGALDALKQRSIHLGFGLALVFLMYPLRKKSGREWPWIDPILAALSAGAIIYILYNYDWITVERISTITPLSFSEKLFGIVSILLVLEGTRRVAGTGLVVVAMIFLAYPFACYLLPGVFHSAPVSWTDLLDFQYLGTSGLFGTPLGVSATDIALFIVFGAILVRCGGSELINHLASAITGRFRGGPAKVAVVASSMMGTITGSGTANVATVGVVTIPMMKKANYEPEFAAAVEAVSSTGGQIMPPIMGATAFVMSAFAGIPYITIVKYAIFPAILYYVGLFMSVHLRAIKLDLKGLEETVSVKEVMKTYGHMLIPVLILIVTLSAGFTPRMASGTSVLSALSISALRPSTRIGLGGIFQAFEDAAKGMLIVILATATAGLIVGSIDITAFGQRLGAVFMSLGAGQLWLSLIMAMLLAVLLGMGMPTTPAYIIQVSTVIPALIKLGVPLFVAHMFAFYFSCLSLITPPVAVTAYAASAIAQSDMWKTGWVAFRLGLPAYIVPFMFVYGQSLLLVGMPGEVILTVVTALIGVCFLAVAGEGYIFKQLSVPERLIALVTALLLIAPSIATTVPGVILGVALIFFNWTAKKRADLLSSGSERIPGA